MRADKARRIAIDIIDEFEELLDRHGIKLPSADREGKEKEACIYGSEYYELEDEITDILVKEAREPARTQGGDAV